MKKVNAAEFKKLVEEGKPMVVDFYADWCGPCKMLTPILEQVSNEITNVEFVKVDVDAERELSTEWGIKSLPTVAFVKGGKPVAGFAGFKPKQLIEEFINKHI